MIDMHSLEKIIKNKLGNDYEVILNTDSTILSIKNKKSDDLADFSFLDIRTTEDVEDLIQEIFIYFKITTQCLYKLCIDFLDESSIKIQISSNQKINNINLMSDIFSKEYNIFQDAEKKERFWLVKTKEIECVTILEILDLKENINE